MVVERARDLQPYLAEWEELARRSVEPNPFYEPWMLLPAVEAFGSGHDFQFLLIFGSAGHNSGEKVLCGFFPMVRSRRYQRQWVGVRVLELYKYPHCGFCLPLVRGGCVAETLEAFLSWYVGQAGYTSLLKLSLVSADGEFYNGWRQCLDRFPRLRTVSEKVERALLRTTGGSQDSIDQTISSRHRKHLRRSRELLSEIGEIRYVNVRRGADAETWIERFTELEVSGWKGEKGTALASMDTSRNFFREAAHTGLSSGALTMFAMFVGAECVAMKCVLRSAAAMFIFKIAYNETFARYSPGVLLEIEHQRQVAEDGTTEWIDSCAPPNHSMYNRIWKERRVLERVLVARRRSPGWVLAKAIARWREYVIRRDERNRAALEATQR